VTALTWLAVAILGPGAVAVFLWFLRDVRDVLDGDRGEDRPPEERERSG
jgi:hypothetical protein